MTALQTPDRTSAPAATGTSTRRRSSALAVAGSLVLAVALRAPYAGVGLSPDEGGVAWVARQWTTGHGSLYGGQWLDRPPLLVALYRVAVTGGPLGVRALGAVAALALVLLAWQLGRSVGDARTGRVAGLLAAVLTGSIAIAAVYAPAELLASVPAAGSVAALLASRRAATHRWLFAAGLLAVAALLIKQSFLDAGLAGAAFLAARSTLGGRGRARAWAAYSAGAVAALVPVAIWLAGSGVSVAALTDALIGFRAQSLQVLQASNLPLQQRLHGLLVPALGSGLFVLVPLAAAGVWRARGDRVLAVTLGAWLAGGAFGVLGGGSYWPHYLIQLLVPAAVGSALVLARVPALPRRVVLSAVAGLAIAASTVGGAVVAVRPPRAVDARVASYVRDHARAGDSFYALYARANLNAAVGLPTPFPYSWSLMMRARPDARPRLLRLLRSPQRPTWIVAWQQPRHWHLDPDGAIAGALRADYRVVHTDHHRRVLLRDDRRPPMPARTP